MSTTIVGLFDTLHQARDAAEELDGSGIDRGDISVVASEPTARDAGWEGREQASITAENAEVGAVIGGAGLGFIGFLAGLGAFFIPGFGPVIAAGWFASMITGAAIGAAAGGILGALTGLGVPEDQARAYEEGVRRGGTLVVVRANEAGASRVADILGAHGAANIEQRATGWRNEGWDGRPPAAREPAGVAHSDTTATPEPRASRPL
ncbi:MAG: hypothetical protein IT208_06535 [Chthonomonadales bacterium]|nr:hypothetical protein [Chthonomonadales bacterium]